MRRAAAWAAVLFLSPAGVGAKVMVLDTFDAGDGKNAFGGMTGAWDADPGDESVSAVARFDDKVRLGDAGKSLRLEYDIKSRRRNVDIPAYQSLTQAAGYQNDEAFNGYYSIFGPANLKGYKYLNLSVRGDAAVGYTRTLRIELKDTRFAASADLNGVTDQWQKFALPLSQFKEIEDWSAIKEFTVVFSPSTVTRRVGAIHIDDIYFSEHPRERIRVVRGERSVPRLSVPPRLDGNLEEWPLEAKTDMSSDPDRYMEIGGADKGGDLGAGFWVGWDDRALYVAVEARDNEVVGVQPPEGMWKEDCVEIYIDPAGDGLEWGNGEDFQLGFSPRGGRWAWFQKRAPSEGEVQSASVQDRRTYRVEAALSWDFLGIRPRKGLALGASVAVHDVDRRGRTPEAKLNWSYEPVQGREDLFKLGTLVLQ